MGNVIERWDYDSRQYFKTAADGSTTQRAFNADENAAADRDVAIRTRQTNLDALKTKALSAFNANKAFLAIASPTNADIVAQVKLLTRENNALIKVLFDQLQDQDGT